MTDEELIKEYPFLKIKNRWTGDESDSDGTELDSMPEGWRVAFGEQLCAELKAELEKVGYLEKYQIADIKEKYGMLCWYDFGNTEAGREIIHKYVELSKRTCIRCGEPATKISTGWISPFCDECASELKGAAFMDIKKFFKEIED